VAAGLRPRAGSDPVAFATKTALSILGRRVLALDEEKERLDGLLAELVTKTAPALVELHGVGVDTAAALLVAAGDNATGSVPRPPGRTCAGWHRSRRPRAR
jgi:transposase